MIYVIIRTNNPDDDEKIAQVCRGFLALADDYEALSDRLPYAEAAVMHIAGIVGLELHGIPAPLWHRGW